MSAVIIILAVFCLVCCCSSVVSPIVMLRGYVSNTTPWIVKKYDLEKEKETMRDCNKLNRLNKKIRKEHTSFFDPYQLQTVTSDEFMEDYFSDEVSNCNLKEMRTGEISLDGTYA